MVTRNARTAPPPPADPQELLANDLQFPSVESFGAAPTPDSIVLHPGRVRGLDYSAWAVALVDLTSRPERIEAERRRIAAKGYKLLGGKPQIEGWTSGEVWVMPRHLYEQRLEARRQRMIDGIGTGQYTEAVLPREIVSRGR